MEHTAEEPLPNYWQPCMLILLSHSELIPQFRSFELFVVCSNGVFCMLLSLLLYEHQGSLWTHPVI